MAPCAIGMNGIGASYAYASAGISQLKSLSKVAAVIKKLKRHRAAGVDGALLDLLKDGKDILLQPLCYLFDKIPEERIPEFILMRIVHPVHKKRGPK